MSTIIYAHDDAAGKVVATGKVEQPQGVTTYAGPLPPEPVEEPVVYKHDKAVGKVVAKRQRKTS